MAFYATFVRKHEQKFITQVKRILWFFFVYFGTTVIRKHEHTEVFHNFVVLFVFAFVCLDFLLVTVI